MKKLMSNKTFPVLAISFSLLAGCGGQSSPQQINPQVDEVEDCDAEDFMNQEEDCGFKKKKKVKKTTTNNQVVTPSSKPKTKASVNTTKPKTSVSKSKSSTSKRK